MDKIINNQSNQATLGESNLFSRLFVYRGREGINPEENFFTEGLAFILDHDRFLLKNLLRLVEKKSKKPWLLHEFLTDNPKVGTQKFYRNRHGRQNFIDLEIKFGGAVLWFEVKVGSGLSGENQIKKYEELIENHEDIVDKTHSGIILLTTSKMDVETDYSHYRGEIYWSEIYTLIKSNLEEMELGDYRRFIENDYLIFIEERGMMPFEQFTKLDQDAAARMKNIDTNVYIVLKHIREKLEKKYSPNNINCSSPTRSHGPGYIGVTAIVNDVEIYFGVVNEYEGFGDVHIWFIPNPDQSKIIQPITENLIDIGFENYGGKYLYKSLGNLRPFDNKNYLDDSSTLVIDKLDYLTKLFPKLDTNP